MSDDDFKRRLPELAAESLMRKGRVYIDSPDEAPDDVQVQEGERGGTFYVTGDGEESNNSDEGQGRSTESEDAQNEYDRTWDDVSGVQYSSRSAAGKVDNNGARKKAKLGKVQRLHEDATTEALEEAAENTFEEEARRLIEGLLYYREDSDVEWEDTMSTDFSSETRDENSSLVKERTEETLENISPPLGALVMAQVEEIRTSNPDNLNGIYTGSARQLGVFEEEPYGMPSITKHEFGHALGYAMGVSGKSRYEGISDRSGFGDELREASKRIQRRTEEYNQLEAVLDPQQLDKDHEVLAVGFAHWLEDKQKLLERQPGLAATFDEHLSEGRDVEEVSLDGEWEDVLSRFEEMGVSEGDRVDIKTDSGEYRNAKIDTLASGLAPGMILQHGPEEISAVPGDIRSVKVPEVNNES